MSLCVRCLETGPCLLSDARLFDRFNTREDNVPVLDIAYHRSTSVIVGVIWALIASRLWWPSEARRELSKALGEYVFFFACDVRIQSSRISSAWHRFCLNIGWLYTRLVASNSGLVDYFDESHEGLQNGSQAPDENTPLLSKSASAQLSDSIQEFMAMYVVTLAMWIWLILQIGNCIFKSN